MAIAPSKLGRFVDQEGFSWPTNQLAAPRDFGAADETPVRRLRETGLVRPEATDSAVAETFRAQFGGHRAARVSSAPRVSETIATSEEREANADHLPPSGSGQGHPLASLVRVSRHR